MIVCLLYNNEIYVNTVLYIYIYIYIYTVYSNDCFIQIQSINIYVNKLQ